jgi:hypothetical protein
MQNFKIGNGYLVSFLSSQGSGIMKWDGEYRVEVNMLITDGNPEEHFDDVVKNFSKTFLKALKSLKLVAQDTFPRGYGKVVNFKHEMLKDLTENGKVVDYVPLWMNRHVPEAMQSSRGPEEDDEFEDEFEEDEM